jgi:hypothetical protein
LVDLDQALDIGGDGAVSGTISTPPIALTKTQAIQLKVATEASRDMRCAIPRLFFSGSAMWPFLESSWLEVADFEA